MLAIWSVQEDGSVQQEPFDGPVEAAVQVLSHRSIPALLVRDRRIEAASGHTRGADLELLRSKISRTTPLQIEVARPSWPIDAWNPDRVCAVGPCGKSIPKPVIAILGGLHVVCYDHRQHAYQLLRGGVSEEHLLAHLLADKPRFFGGRHVEGVCAVCGVRRRCGAGATPPAERVQASLSVTPHEGPVAPSEQARTDARPGPLTHAGTRKRMILEQIPDGACEILGRIARERNATIALNPMFVSDVPAVIFDAKGQKVTALEWSCRVEFWTDAGRVCSSHAYGKPIRDAIFVALERSIGLIDQHEASLRVDLKKARRAARKSHIAAIIEAIVALKQSALVALEALRAAWPDQAAPSASEEAA